MLEFIRKKQKSVLVQIVFWAIIATFVGTIFLVWGKGGDNAAQEDYAVKVNGSKIGFDQYQQAYENIYRIYQNLYGEAFTPAVEKELNLRKTALDSLIDQALLIQEAERQGLKVSKDEVVAAIAKIPAFQENGTFNRDRYIQVLRGQRLTPDLFEQMQQRELLVDKARTAVEGGATASEAEVAQEYKERNEKVDLYIARLDPAAFESQVRIDPAGVQSFFAGKKEAFRLPETVNLNYLIIDAKPFSANVKLTDAELEKYYQRNIDRFEVPEQVHAAHILIRVPQGASEAVKAEKKALIEKLRDRARKGEDFAALARSSSEDPGSAAQGGDLGFFGRGSMVAPFEQAAFALKTGEISDVVTTDFGYHVIRLIARQEAQIKPRSAVADQVEAGASAEKARELALEKAMDLYNVNRKGGTLDAVAKATGSAIRESGFFTEAKPVLLGSPLPKELATIAFGLKAGEFGRPVLLPQGALVYTLKEKREAHVPELAEVRPAVEAAYRKAKAKDLARAVGNQLLAEVRGGADFATVAAKHSLPAAETGLFARSRTFFVPKIGENEALSQAAFALTAAAPVPATVFEVNDAIYAIRLKERRNAEAAGLTATMRDETRNAVLERKKKEVLEAALKGLREKSQIIYAASVEADQKG